MTDYYTLLSTMDFIHPKLLDRERIRGNLAGATADTVGRFEIEEPIHWRVEKDRPVTDWIIGASPALMLSTRFRAVLDANLGPADEIQWIASEVEMLDGTVVPYWTPHFPRPRDVLDEVLTERGPSGIPAIWFVSRAKMHGIRVTDAGMPATLVVDAGIRDLLQQEALTGFHMLRSRITD